MRTRNRTIITNPVAHSATKVSLIPTYVSGPAGAQPMFPLREISRTPVMESPGVGVGNNSTESITDEVGVGRPMRDVLHVTRQQPYLKPHDVITNVYGLKKEYYGPLYAGVSELRLNSVDLARRAYYDVSTQMSLNPMYVQNTSFGYSPFVDRLGELPARVLTAIEELHLSTTLIESRELPALAKTFHGREGLGPTTLLLLKGIRRKDPKATVKALIKLTKTGQLAYSFGLMPTIRDVQNITSAVVSASDGLTALRKEFSVSITQERELSPTTKQSFGANQYSYGSATGVSWSSARRIDGVRVTWKRHRYNSDFFKDADEYLTRYVGLNPLGLAWEVMPISFMVDWLISVDDVLDSLWLHNQSNFGLQYWTSVKYENTLRVVYTYLTGVDGLYSSPTYTRKDAEPLTSKYTSYNRTKRDPPGPFDSLRLRGASLGNLYLASLIALGLAKPSKKL